MTEKASAGAAAPPKRSGCAVILLLAVAGIGWFFYSAYQEDKTLTVEQRYARECANEGVAVIMAQRFIRERINSAETPKFESWGFKDKVRRNTSAGQDCSFTVSDHFTFANEQGGKSRRWGRVELGPLKDDPTRWRLLSIEVR